MNDENNMKRLMASQIIVDLFEAKEFNQLKLLKISVDEALKRLDEQHNLPGKAVIRDEDGNVVALEG